MGQHRRFPANFLLAFAILALPSLLYGFIKASERADEECTALAQSANKIEQTKGQLKCE